MPAVDASFFCQRCHRPARFFGNRDIETGWEGWCLICNWVWRFGDVTRVIEFRLLKNLRLPRDGAQGAVCVFLAGEACYARVLSGLARAELRQVQQNAIRKVRLDKERTQLIAMGARLDSARARLIRASNTTAAAAVALNMARKAMEDAKAEQADTEA